MREEVLIVGEFSLSFYVYERILHGLLDLLGFISSKWRLIPVDSFILRVAGTLLELAESKTALVVIMRTLSSRHQSQINFIRIPKLYQFFQFI